MAERRRKRASLLFLSRALVASAFVTTTPHHAAGHRGCIVRSSLPPCPPSETAACLLVSSRRRAPLLALPAATANDAQPGSNSSTTSTSISAAAAATTTSQFTSWEEVLSPHDQNDDIDESSIERPRHSQITAKDRRILALVVAGAVLGVSGLVKASGPGSWRYYVAGGLCAAISHTIPVPIDVVKTRKQVDPVYQDLNVWDATRRLIQTEGLKSLAAGLGPTTVGYLFEGAIKFGVYEVLKPIVRTVLVAIAGEFPALVFLNTQLVAFMACGTVSGMAAAVVLAPMEGLRIRMVAEPDFAPRGWVGGAYRMFKEEGAGFLVKGVKPMMYKQVPYTVTKNVAFDFFAKHAYASLRQNGVDPTPAIKFTVPLLAAFVASVLSCVTSQPGDMLLSLVNAHGGDRRTRDIVKDILRSERGMSGFFAGFKTRIVHVGLIVTLQLLLYDMIKRLCGIAATGLS